MVFRNFIDWKLMKYLLVRNFDFNFPKKLGPSWTVDIYNAIYTKNFSSVDK